MNSILKYFKVLPEGELIQCLYDGKRIVRGRGVESKMFYRIDLRVYKILWI